MIDRLSLPTSRGAYTVEFHLETAIGLTIGKLGDAFFPAGIYLYQGIAGGSGGLRARLGRHLCSEVARPHWHVDYLHQAMYPAACAYLQFPSTPTIGVALECVWSKALAALPGAGQPMAGFGASDCRAGCLAHLVHFQNPAPSYILLRSESILAGLEQMARYIGNLTILSNDP